MTESTERASNEGVTVTEEEIAAAMGVNSVPDSVRLTSTDPDETGLVIDGSGELRPPSEEQPGS